MLLVTLVLFLLSQNVVRGKKSVHSLKLRMNLTAKVRHFRKYAHLLSGGKLDERMSSHISLLNIRLQPTAAALCYAKLTSCWP